MTKTYTHDDVTYTMKRGAMGVWHLYLGNRLLDRDQHQNDLIDRIRTGKYDRFEFHSDDYIIHA